ncbi:hypothetical protein ACRN96_00870 [Shewanella oncorhynchi]|uniref:hypothetical protein n=1 Tax=Shewanella TaxID=22 RepID=UPI0021DA7661|nr:hypothetical protein [Shewanella sp. SM23]MCU8083989.1 hypothetical protein [Shewanella sp. SM23]
MGLMLSTLTPVTRRKLVPEGSTTASMPPTVTAARVLNVINLFIYLLYAKVNISHSIK